MTFGETHQTPTYYGYYDILYSTLYGLGTWKHWYKALGYRENSWKTLR